jgi:hypothetical protein
VTHEPLKVSYFAELIDIMRLAYQLAVRNEIKKQFCKRNENAGRNEILGSNEQNFGYKFYSF